nr:hypothetical protein [Nocardia cyriacigeorgica]
MPDYNAGRQSRCRHQQSGVLHIGQRLPAAGGDEEFAPPHDSGGMHRQPVGLGIGHPVLYERTAGDRTGCVGHRKVYEVTGAEQVTRGSYGESRGRMLVEGGGEDGECLRFEFVVGVQILDQCRARPAQRDIARHGGTFSGAVGRDPNAGILRRTTFDQGGTCRTGRTIDLYQPPPIGVRLRQQRSPSGRKKSGIVRMYRRDHLDPHDRKCAIRADPAPMW